MMIVDIHSHILANTDDGAKSIEEMYKLIDEEYLQGVRYLCFTPHFHPGYYGDNTSKRDEAFIQAMQYSNEKYSDLILYLGNELHFYQGCLEALKDGKCLTLNHNRYLLVDFSYDENYKTIESALMSILRQGYIPVLAHVERYKCFTTRKRSIEYLHNLGVYIQVNASSIVERKHYWIIRWMLKRQLVDVIASDTHSFERRPPMLSDAYIKISDGYGEEYAELLFFTNPYNLLND